MHVYFPVCIMCADLQVFGSRVNLGRRFGTSKMHLSPPVAKVAVRSKAVVLLLLTFVYGYSHCGSL